MQYAATHQEAKNTQQVQLFADTAKELVFFGKRCNEKGHEQRADSLFHSALICVRSGTQLLDQDCDEVVSCLNHDILCSLSLLVREAAQSTDCKLDDFFVDEITTVIVGTKVIHELEANGQHELAHWLGQTIKTQIACIERGIICQPEAMPVANAHPELHGDQNTTTTTTTTEPPSPRTARRMLDDEMILNGEMDCSMAYAEGLSNAGEYLLALSQGLGIGAIKVFDPRTMVHMVHFGAGASIFVVDQLSNLLAEGIARVGCNDNVTAYFKAQRVARQEALVKAVQQWGEQLMQTDGAEIAFSIGEFLGSFTGAKPAGMLHMKMLGAGLGAGKAGASKVFEKIGDFLKKNPELAATTPEGFIFKAAEEMGGLEGAAEVVGGEVMLEEVQDVAKAGKEVVKDGVKVGEEPLQTGDIGKCIVKKSKYWHPNYVDNLQDSQILLGVQSSAKGSSTLGSASSVELWKAGTAWVGENAIPILEEGKHIGYCSKDGLKVFRLHLKKKAAIIRANFQEFMIDGLRNNAKTEIRNVHIDPTDL